MGKRGKRRGSGWGLSDDPEGQRPSTEGRRRLGGRGDWKDAEVAAEEWLMIGGLGGGLWEADD